MNKILPFQNELYQVLQVVIGNAEYNNFVTIQVTS